MMVKIKQKTITVGCGPQEKNRLFKNANTAWDNGDLRGAFALFTRAAHLGDRASQLDLGYFFDQGLFVKKNKQKALVWYHRAYQQGDASAANNIATVYRDLGDIRKMLWWFRRAAAMGDLDALLDFGKRYEKGLEVPRNPLKAKSYFGRVLANKHASKEDKAEALSRLSRLRKGNTYGLDRSDHK
ncbi:MAG: sel1 repeat family protein [Verrucomicrobia bacterium]|nr:sel1 repeat family protein [Verrucomicrobiota bacterium]